MSSPVLLTPILRQMVKNAPSGLPPKGVAELVGRDYTTLMAELGERSGHKLGVDMLLPLMELTGSDLPMQVLAEAMGGFFVRMPRVDSDDCTEVTRQCLTSVREFGEMMGTVADALDDGTITEEERRRIADKGYHTQTAILALLRLVEDASRKP